MPPWSKLECPSSDPRTHITPDAEHKHLQSQHAHSRKGCGDRRIPVTGSPANLENAAVNNERPQTTWKARTKDQPPKVALWCPYMCCDTCMPAALTHERACTHTCNTHITHTKQQKKYRSSRILAFAFIVLLYFGVQKYNAQNNKNIHVKIKVRARKMIHGIKCFLCNSEYLKSFLQPFIKGGKLWWTSVIPCTFSKKECGHRRMAWKLADRTVNSETLLPPNKVEGEVHQKLSSDTTCALWHMNAWTLTNMCARTCTHVQNQSKYKKKFSRKKIKVKSSIFEANGDGRFL